jgi:hypothetical protein
VSFLELRSGRSDSLADYQLGSEPPHAHGPDVLYVGFTGAEPEFYHSVGWPFDHPFLDLRVVGICQTNFAYRRDDLRREKLPRSLIQFLRANGIKDGDEAIKDALRKRIIQGHPFTAEEYRQILAYCAKDVRLLKQLLDVLLPRIPNFAQALQFGEYVKFAAEVFVRGISADPWAAGLLREPENRQVLRLRAVSDQTLSHGLFQEDATLPQPKLREFLVRHNIDSWRLTKHGKFGTKNQDFELLETANPDLKGIADV